jgi:hypothetical protein
VVTRAANVVRIMTANRASGKADAATFARMVQAWAPDAVAVQEIDDVQAGHLAEVLPFERLEAKPVGTGAGIGLQKPGPVSEISLPYRSAYSAKLKAGDEHIELVNVHVLAPQAAPLWRHPCGPSTAASRGGFTTAPSKSRNAEAAVLCARGVRFRAGRACCASTTFSPRA